jgi:hypothetical protein
MALTSPCVTRLQARGNGKGVASTGRCCSTPSGETKVTDSTESARTALPAGNVLAGVGLGVGIGVAVAGNWDEVGVAIWLGVPLALPRAGVGEQPTSSVAAGVFILLGHPSIGHGLGNGPLANLRSTDGVWVAALGQPRRHVRSLAASAGLIGR